MDEEALRQETSGCGAINLYPSACHKKDKLFRQMSVRQTDKEVSQLRGSLSDGDANDNDDHDRGDEDDDDDEDG